MKSDINDLCEAFLAALTNAGYAVKSIENYKQVSNRFICLEKQKQWICIKPAFLYHL